MFDRDRTLERTIRGRARVARAQVPSGAGVRAKVVELHDVLHLFPHIEVLRRHDGGEVEGRKRSPKVDLAARRAVGDSARLHRQQRLAFERVGYARPHQREEGRRDVDGANLCVDSHPRRHDPRPLEQERDFHDLGVEVVPVLGRAVLAKTPRRDRM